RHVATKLVRRFVAEDVPAALVARTAGTFSGSAGDIKMTLKTIFDSEEFANSAGFKFKRPVHFILSSLRALGAAPHAHPPLIEYLQRMGQGPFQHPTPDGYPDRAAPWLGTLLWRWNFAFALSSNRVPTVSVSLEQLARALNGEAAGLQPHRLLPHLVGRLGTENEIAALEGYRRGGAGAGPSES